MSKTIFITGASSGLGRATAKLFQAKGWHVIATMRNPERETELKQLENVTVLPLDVTDKAGVTEGIENLIETNSVDVVVNNAGYGLIGVLEGFSDDQITKQIDTNLLGTIRVTKAFVPYFRHRGGGMFINITSMLGLVGYPTCSLYAATKFAIDGFSESLAYDLAHFNIKVKIIAPGGIQTDFAGRSMDIGQHEAYQRLVEKVSEGYSAESIQQFDTPGAVASVIYEAATDGKDQLRYVTGADAVSLFSERKATVQKLNIKEFKRNFPIKLNNMKSQAIEITSFKLKGYTFREFIDANKTDIDEWLKKQDGFQSRHIVEGAGGTIMDIVFWDNIAQGTEAMHHILSETSHSKIHSMIDQRTVSWNIYEVGHFLNGAR